MLARMRIAFLGNDPWSVPSLERLAAASEIDVAVVATRVPRPAGRGSKLTPTKVAEAARALGLPLVETESVRGGDGFEVLRDVKPDVLVVVAYGEILTADVLYLATPVNVHFSLLPRWRGAAPVQRAILAGDRTTGVTVMLMDEGLDTGPIVAARRWALDGTETAPEVEAQAAEAGAELVTAILGPWLRGEVTARPQPAEGVTVTRPLRREDGRLDPARTAAELERQVRALQPWPGTFVETGTGRIKVFRAVVAPGPAVAAAAPGEPGSFGEGPGLRLHTADGELVLVEVQPAGGRRMTGEELVLGRPGLPGSRVLGASAGRPRLTM